MDTSRTLNLDDIQGNIPRAYGRYSFPFARYFFLHIEDPAAGRAFVNRVRAKVTTASRWTPETKPLVTLNIGFTFFGLYMLGLPTRTLQGMPESFVDGMKARAFILGDRDNTQTQEAAEADAWCRHWDPIWQQNRQPGGQNDVHIWMSMNAQVAAEGTAQPSPALEEQTLWLQEICSALGQKVRILATNGQAGDQLYQAASAIFADYNGIKVPTPKEHFGFTDGIGDPVFAGQFPAEEEKLAAIGRGKRMSRGAGWVPLATGEFLLGHPDESQEIPPTAPPPNLMHNGSFMVYRKLHENVGTFDAVIAEEAETFAAQKGISVDEAAETIKAKMVGRWSDGVPLSTVPTFTAWRAFRADKGLDDPDPFRAAKALRAYLGSPEASDFGFADDMNGIKCPVGAHLRRVNTRDYLDPLNQAGAENPDASTQLNKRRRILRRGLPYGPSVSDQRSDETEQGVAMMIIGASIFRQFEFVQQQWVQYGLDFHQGNNTCPIVGNHDRHKRFTIPVDPRDGAPPFIMSKLKTFVEPRGGDYFFLPSLSALQMIAAGVVDPT
ncbi:peroxidase [Pseudoruegeria sp. SK021]|uniref:Dyp-type peroxidase n=1 Tax=Pseudoruegeria sp. SK021 TaxID=1933035 RepID=UPI000A2629E6|nr:peroxidase [Pseudoruegeria sp. SK021]OSP56828.1 peroxidase [Pseudoruegeria sp. SK021]